MTMMFIFTAVFLKPYVRYPLSECSDPMQGFTMQRKKHRIIVSFSLYSDFNCTLKTSLFYILKKHFKNPYSECEVSWDLAQVLFLAAILFLFF